MNRDREGELYTMQKRLLIPRFAFQVWLHRKISQRLAEQIALPEIDKFVASTA